MEITRPCNLLGLDEEAAEHIFVAGKIGVAPILSIGRRLSELGAGKTLHLRAPSAADTPFLDDVKEVFGDDVIFHHDGGDVSAGLALKEVLTNPPEDAHLYLSGPPGLIDVARQTAVGWPSGKVSHLNFTANPTDGAANEEFEVSFARDKKIVTVPVDKTILDVAREADLVVETPCDDGLCGRCRTTLLGGARPSAATSSSGRRNGRVIRPSSPAGFGPRQENAWS